MPKPTLTFEEADELLSYCPSTGIFVWKVDRNGRGGRTIGNTAGCKDSNGYISIGISLTKGESRNYKSHRIAWLLHYGEWPRLLIDHINGDRSDNRIKNLRLADPSQNNFNRRPQKDSSHGLKGLIFDPDKCKGGRWRARIQARGKRIHLGWFKTEGESIEAYKKGMDLYHEGFAPDLTVRKQSFLLRPEPKTKEVA